MIKLHSPNRYFTKNRDLFLKKLNDFLEEGVYIGGKHVIDFEKSYASYVGRDYAIGVGNGTDAIEIGLKALSLEPGTHVLIPNLTFVATAEAVLNNQLNIVTYDINHDTLNADENSILEKIKNNPNIGALICVPLFGYPLNADSLSKLASEFNLKLITDCAQSHGSVYNNVKSSSFGDFSSYSFFPGKNLGCHGDGGAITTDNEELYNVVSILRDHGRHSKHSHELVGRNSRIDPLQCIFLNEYLKELDNRVYLRNMNAQVYNEVIPGDVHKGFDYNNNFKHAYHQYVCSFDSHNEMLNFSSYMGSHNIQTGIHYPYTIDKLNVYNTNKIYSNPVSDSLCERIVSIPVSDTLENNEIDSIYRALFAYFK